MQVKIVMEERESFWLEVAPYYSFRIVKRKIEHLYGVSEEHQSISYNSRKVNNNSLLSKCCVKNNDTFEISLDSECFKLCFKEAKEFLYQYTVKPSYTIRRVKDFIYDNTHTPPHMQKLMFNGLELDDQHSLADYNINANSTVIVNRNFEPIVKNLKSITSILEEMILNK